MHSSLSRSLCQNLLHKEEADYEENKEICRMLTCVGDKCPLAPSLLPLISSNSSADILLHLFPCLSLSFSLALTSSSEDKLLCLFSCPNLLFYLALAISYADIFLRLSSFLSLLFSLLLPFFLQMYYFIFPHASICYFPCSYNFFCRHLTLPFLLPLSVIYSSFFHFFCKHIIVPFFLP